jgi:hypothetical protein
MTSWQGNKYNANDLMGILGNVNHAKDDARIANLSAEDQRLYRALKNYAMPKLKEHNTRNYVIPFQKSDSANARVAIFPTDEGKKAIVKVCLSADSDPIHQDAFVLNTIWTWLTKQNLHNNAFYLMGYHDIFTANITTEIGNAKNFTGIDVTPVLSSFNQLSTGPRYPCILSPANNVKKTLRGIMLDAYRPEVFIINLNQRFEQLNELFTYLVNLSHATGFAHNDMHNGNILYDESLEKFVLIDFGRAFVDISKFQNYAQLQQSYEDIKSVFNPSAVYANQSGLMEDIRTIEKLFEYAQRRIFTKVKSEYGIWADMGGLLLSMCQQQRDVKGGLWFLKHLMAHCGATHQNLCPFFIDGNKLQLNMGAAKAWWTTGGDNSNSILKKSIGWIAMALCICCINKKEMNMSLGNSESSILVPIDDIFTSDEDVKSAPLFVSGIMYTSYFALINKYFKHFESRIQGGGMMKRKMRGGAEVGNIVLHYVEPNVEPLYNDVPLTPPHPRRKAMLGGRKQRGGSVNIQEDLIHQNDKVAAQESNILAYLGISTSGGALKHKQRQSKKTHIRLKGQDKADARVRLVKTNDAGERYVTISKKAVLLRDIKGRYTYV